MSEITILSLGYINLAVLLFFLVRKGAPLIISFFASRHKQIKADVAAASEKLQHANARLLVAKNTIGTITADMNKKIYIIEKNTEAECISINSEAKKLSEIIINSANKFCVAASSRRIIELEKQIVFDAIDLAEEEIKQRLSDNLQGEVLDRSLDKFQKLISEDYASNLITGSAK